jgi:site-specific DNA-methyltransferase (adenine-specific)
MSEIATECNRVLKPGGHALVWALPRTSHWTATAWENAGFEIRDVIAHVFGSGFPKNMNVGMAVDKLLGNEREIVKIRTDGNKGGGAKTFDDDNYIWNKPFNQTKGNSEWEGYGTALKPAREDWILMRKPISENTIAENCLKWGVGGINIDGCRIETDESTVRPNGKDAGMWAGKGQGFSGGTQGRFPANLVHDNSEEVTSLFPNTKSSGNKNRDNSADGNGDSFTISKQRTGISVYPKDSGSAARFFYSPKPSKAERNAGCYELELKSGGSYKFREDGSLDGKIPNNNNHPTVKSVALMQYLCRLITPKGGVILDPFMGSGTTGCAAMLENFGFIGIEKESEYYEISEKRINYYESCEKE